MTKCPFFGLCGGCKYDFTSGDYRAQKLKNLPRGVNPESAVWGTPGIRRRGDFAAVNGHFGFYRAGSRDIIDITNCPNMAPDINAVLPDLAALPWGGAASVLVTLCDNGVVVNVQSDVPYCSGEFRICVQRLSAMIIRFTWNGTVLREYAKPYISFDGKEVEFPDGAFLQPTVATENILRNMVVGAVGDLTRVADLFCGLGNFTYATGADGFDISGVGVQRDLFKRPLSLNKLNEYDVVIMDPPRAGAMAQSKILAESKVSRIIYISCNPDTWLRDKMILERGGYKMTKCTPVDQFVGASHWEIFSVFERV